MLLLLVVDDKTSPPTGVVEEGVSTKRSIWNSAVDEALSIQDASRDPNQTREALLCWIHQFNQFGLEHKLDWRSLPPLLNAAKVCCLLLCLSNLVLLPFLSCLSLKTIMYLNYTTFVRLPYLPLKKMSSFHTLLRKDNNHRSSQI